LELALCVDEVADADPELVCPLEGAAALCELGDVAAPEVASCDTANGAMAAASASARRKFMFFMETLLVQVRNLWLFLAYLYTYRDAIAPEQVGSSHMKPERTS